MTERLGLPAELVSDARARLSDKEAQAEALLRKLESEQEVIADRERRVGAQEKLVREALEAQRTAAREAEAERERTRQAFAADLRRRSDELARKAADAVKEAVQRLETSRRSAANEGARARSHAVEAIRGARDEALASAGVATAAPSPASRREPVRGDRVRVTDLGIVGEVVAVHEDGELEVAVGGKRLRAPRHAVTVIEGAKPTARAHSAMPSARGGSSDTSAEIHIVGLTVDEALPRVDKGLDQAALADHHEVRIVHGFGQGRLRQAVAEMLDGHPHVATFRPGGPREGGGGVTVVELKE